MRARELKDLYNRTKELESLKERIATLKSNCTRITSYISGMPKSKTVRMGMEELIVRLLETRARYEEELREYYEAQAKAMIEIESRVKDKRASLILYKRYIEAQTWKEIRGTLKCSLSRVYQWHRAGLKEFEAAEDN